MYSYSPGSPGTFSDGGSAPGLSITLKNNGSKSTIGLYFRTNAQLKLTKKTILEISPFSNINSIESVYGIQLGFVFGGSYKNNFFK
ncbi:MAG: hypothetical protein QNJ57_06510 [Flavobacteriaceae bacterium]|nr:hypothetical protein [Flavobacteriaceae bacterium]